MGWGRSGDPCRSLVMSGRTACGQVTLGSGIFNTDSSCTDGSTWARGPGASPVWWSFQQLLKVPMAQEAAEGTCVSLCPHHRHPVPVPLPQATLA